MVSVPLGRDHLSGADDEVARRHVDDGLRHASAPDQLEVGGRAGPEVRFGQAQPTSVSAPITRGAAAIPGAGR
jgi:hypothetical protein